MATKRKKNILWYLNNLDNLSFIENGGIKILGDEFELEDENPQNLQNGILLNQSNGKKYFTYYSAINYAILNGKKLPEWKKYIDFLPGNNLNKISFLTEVLGLQTSDYFLFNNESCGQGRQIWSYWSNSENYLDSSNANILEFTSMEINSECCYPKNYFFPLRCIKN